MPEDLRDLPEDDPGASLERRQPDPMLQLSTGRLGPGGLSLVAVAIVVIVGVVFYGLSRPTGHEATAPAAAPAAAHAPAPTPPAAPGNH